MTGAVILFLVGAGFLGAAARAWTKRGTGGRGVLTVWVDVLVGTVALGDAASSVADQPVRVLLWAAGSAVLVATVALLAVQVLRTRQF